MVESFKRRGVETLWLYNSVVSNIYTDSSANRRSQRADVKLFTLLRELTYIDKSDKVDNIILNGPEL